MTYKTHYKYNKLPGPHGGSVETANFWVVTKCCLVYSNQHLGGIRSLILNIIKVYLEDGSSMLPRNCGSQLSDLN
jgi:hypothetical protein